MSSRLHMHGKAQASGGPTLGGTWTGTFVSAAGYSYKIKAELLQRFSRDSGTIELLKVIKGTHKTEQKAFAVHGFVHDGCLTLAACNSSGNSAGVHALLLQVTDDSRLKGKILYYRVINRKIERGGMEWRKA